MKTAAFAFVKGRFGGLLLAGLLTLTATPTFASANVDCVIDDRFIKFEMEAIAGRNGPIVQVNVGTIAIKPAGGITTSAPEIAFDRTHITQQWLYGDDLRLHFEINDEKARELIELVIQARLDKKREKYAGGYVLKVSRDGKSKELKGRIKECVAG